jgi:Leucine-rich repeat (LRR) protein
MELTSRKCYKDEILIYSYVHQSIISNSCQRISANQLKLTKLNLESNSIEIMKENTFYNLNQLKELNLNNNTIKTIENNAFNGLFNLENFNISGNPLNYVDNGSFN